MATFKYISKDMSAKTIRGTLEADDRNDLVRKLKEQNLFLVSCQDVTKKTVNQYKMKLNELSAYSREIGTMLASGLSLIRIFSIMVRREDNKKIAEQIVAYLFGRPYAFNVMPESFWLEQRQSYLEQKKQGIEPRLKQYSQDIKNVINYNEEVQSKKDDFIDNIVNLYGADLVNIIDE